MATRHGYGSRGAHVTAGWTVPSWSPDGERLIYRVTFGDGNPWALWTADADGSGETLLLEPDGGASARRARWSPTGDRVLFSRYTVQCGPNANNACPPNLYIVPGDGSGSEVGLVQRAGGAEAGSWRAAVGG